ncbi:hypothetical protein L226DRAFT_608471 [Lentinus tigrinus ALCF2SS1-7]
MDPDGFDKGPPFQPPPMPMNGYYCPASASAIQPPRSFYHQCQLGWQPQPQPVFAPPQPQWPPFGAGDASGARGRLDRERAVQVLTDALRRGKELRLSSREVLERLHSSDKPEYRGIDWTGLFLESADMPGPSSNRDESRNPGSASQATRSTASRSSDEPAQKKRKTTKETRPKVGRPRGRPRGRPPTRKVANQRHAAPPGRSSRSRDERSLPPSASTPAASTSTSSTRGSESRTKRRGRLLEFHDETYVPPPADPLIKPLVPRRDSGADLNRFSDEEKIFFIHYLRWRLREGTVPSKLTLFNELAKELPHHDAQAWKKHWKDHPELPESIYIAALKGAGDQDLVSSHLSDSSKTLTHAASSDDEYRPSSPRDGHQSPSQVEASASYPSRVHRTSRKHKITEDDLRAMAMYMVEKRRVWSHYKNHSQRWKEFCSREENLKRRSRSGWNYVARTYAAQIRDCYDEYMAKKSNSESQSEEDERDEGETRNPVYPPSDESARPPTAEPETGPEDPGTSASAPANPSQKRLAAQSQSHNKQIFTTTKAKREYIEVSD